MVPRDRANHSDDEDRSRNSNFFGAQTTTAKASEMINNTSQDATADESRMVPRPKRNDIEHHRQKPDSILIQTSTPKAMETVYITHSVETADES
jgi:hypothetical protein